MTAAGNARPPHMAGPSSWVMRFLPGVAPAGRVLDLACGGGRHVGPCLERGMIVTAVDRDVSHLRQSFSGEPVNRLRILEIDLEDGRPFPFPPGSFDGIIVTNYLWRPILAGIVEAVSPGGVLIYETFRLGNERYGRPKNPEFLLKPGELLAMAYDRLHVVVFEEARLTMPDRVVQRICAVGPAHPWLEEPPVA